MRIHVKKKKKQKKINSQIRTTQILAISYHRLSDPISLNNHVFEYTWLHTSPSLFSPSPVHRPPSFIFPSKFQPGTKWSEINFTDGVWTHQENQAARRVPLESFRDTLNLIPKERSAGARRTVSVPVRQRERRTIEERLKRVTRGMAVNPKILAIKSRLISSFAGAITLLSLWLRHCTSLTFFFFFFLFFFRSFAIHSKLSREETK